MVVSLQDSLEKQAHRQEVYVVFILQEGELGEAKTRQEVYLVSFLTQVVTVCSLLPGVQPHSLVQMTSIKRVGAQKM